MTVSRSIPDRCAKVMLDPMTTIRCQSAALGSALGDDAAAPAGVVSEPVVAVGAVGPSRRRVAILPTNDRAAGAARAVVRSTCVRWGVGSVAELAVLCVSELAANAAKHVTWGRVPWGRRVVWLVVELWGSLLVVEVRDPSDVMPTVGVEIDWSSVGSAAADVWGLPESGFGLRVVADQVAGVEGVFGAVGLPQGGKSVFFSVPVQRRAAP